MSNVSIFKSEEGNAKEACGERLKASDFMLVFRFFWRFLYKNKKGKAA